MILSTFNIKKLIPLLFLLVYLCCHQRLCISGTPNSMALYKCFIIIIIFY